MSQNRDVEPYQPNFSSGVQPTSPPVVKQAGCLERSFRLLVIAGISAFALICIVVAASAVFSLGSLGESFSEFCLYNCESDVIEVNVQPFILALKQEAFLETLRSPQVYEIYASNEMPGVIPGRRSMRYKAFMTITAGIDLQLVENSDFVTDGTSITITLPKPQLRDCVLDTQQSFFYEKSCNYVGCGNLEEILVNRAYEMPTTEGYEILLTEAWENAVQEIDKMARNFGYQTVTIQQTSDDMFYVSNDSTCKVPPELLQPTPTP